ncbi:MAG: N-acetylmuramoyl-L-alanine amidase [Paludibacteraceae bacterium]|nr:N-acetylmuramoyl-L-alanine amidase [Paludibacteraceae bacterium]
MNKPVLTITLILSLLLAVGQTVSAFNVVIDAGHGGKDPGACGALTTEKALNLAVAQRLNKLLKDSCKDVNVYMTRTTDVFLTLQERANFVNKHNADLFICIHANSAENKKMNGAETYTLGLHKLDSNFDVAKRENSVIMLEDNYQTTYQGFDPNSVESYIMFEFMQDSYLDKSLQFASLVQQQLSANCSRADRGVRQAGFWVLHKSACPSVLVEMGFISNPDEEKYLVSELGKQQIATAIYNAFLAYKNSLDKKSATMASAAAEEGDKVEEKPADTKNVETAKTDKKKSDNKKTEPKKSDTKKAEVKQNAETKKTDQKAEVKKNTETKKPEQKAEIKPHAKSPKPVFRVQIFSVTSELKAGDPSFKGLKGCKYTKDGKFLKYTYGEETSYDEIKKVRDTLLPKFKDCFIVAFLDGKQIYVKDALKMIQ